MNGTDGRKTGWTIEGCHVYPVNDLREHVPGDCWCRPRDDEGINVHNQPRLPRIVRAGRAQTIVNSQRDATTA